MERWRFIQDVRNTQDDWLILKISALHNMDIMGKIEKGGDNAYEI